MSRPPKKIPRQPADARAQPVGSIQRAGAARRARPDASAASPAPAATVFASESLDRTDRSLLKLLQANGRLTNLELAEAVHLSPAACHERIRKLHGRGLIRGYAALLDADAVGAGMLVFVTVSLDRTTPDVFDRFKSSIQAHAEILEAHLVAGGFDYLLKIRVRDMRAYRALIARGVWAIAGVRETHTYVVMEEVKETTQLPL